MNRVSLQTLRSLRREQGRLRSNVKALLKLNGAEKGSTVFVVGAGTQLNSLTKKQLDALGRRPTIGLNRTQFAVNLRYFLSAYPHEVFLASSHAPRVTTINMRPNLASPLIPGTLAVKRVDHSLGDSLSPSFHPSEPSLHTLRNVAFGATHLALILGARRIVYIGIQQTNGLHYYDEIAELRDLVAARLRAVPANLFAVDHPYATLEASLDGLRVPKEVLANQPFFKESHRETFQDFFRALGEHGVETFTTLSESVVASAGAQVVPLDQALSW